MLSSRNGYSTSDDDKPGRSFMKDLSSEVERLNNQVNSLYEINKSQLSYISVLKNELSLEKSKIDNVRENCKFYMELSINNDYDKGFYKAFEVVYQFLTNKK